MKTVFLDFDGVLFDTLKEAYVLCRYAYNKTNIFEDIDETFYKEFYKYKFLVYNSWQYYYLMKLLTEQKYKSEEDFIQKYTNCMNNRSFKDEEFFDEQYLKKRIELMNKHTEYWNKLEQPFLFFYSIKQLFDEHKINPIIVSKKNKFAIEHRLKQYELDITPTQIIAKEELLPYSTKAEFMNEYMSKNNIKDAYFVDDNSNNLTPCNQYPQIKPLLAGWGNIAINETGLSAEDIINILC